MNLKISEFLCLTFILFGAVCASDNTTALETPKAEEKKTLQIETGSGEPSLNITTHDTDHAKIPLEEATPNSQKSTSANTQRSSIPETSAITTKVTASSTTTMSPQPSPTPPPVQTPAAKEVVTQTTQNPKIKSVVDAISAFSTPELGKWIIRDEKTNMTCIIAQMAMQLNITYPVNKTQFENTTLNVPGNATAVGKCNSTAQSMVISWGPGHNLQINFGVNEKAKDFYVSGLSLNVSASVLQNYTGNDSFIQYTNKQKEFQTPLDMSYKCDKAQKVNLTSSDSLAGAVLTLKNTQFEAFMNSTKVEFGAADDCEVFDTPDIVPIAVGCALAILVLVVLVAYLIGRKRSQNTGYLSM